MFRSAQKVFASLAPGLRAGLTVDSGSDGSCVDHVLEVSSRKPDGHLGQLVDVNGVVVLDLALKKKDRVGKFVRLRRDGCLSKHTKYCNIFCSVGQSQDMIIFHARTQD